MRVTYPQLDDEAMALLTARLDHHGGNRAALARELGVARTSVSQALDGRYPGDTRKLRARIMELLADQQACPHLGRPIPPGLCRSYRERTMAQAATSRADVKHWQACRSCQSNPARPTEKEAAE